MPLDHCWQCAEVQLAIERHSARRRQNHSARLDQSQGVISVDGPLDIHRAAQRDFETTRVSKHLPKQSLRFRPNTGEHSAVGAKTDSVAALFTGDEAIR